MFSRFLQSSKKNIEKKTYHTDLSSWPDRLESRLASFSFHSTFLTKLWGSLVFDFPKWPNTNSRTEKKLCFSGWGALNSLSFILVACCNSSLDSAPFKEFSKFLKFPKNVEKPSKSTLNQLNLLNLLWCFARFARTYSGSGNTLCNFQVVWLGRRAQP